MFLTKDTKSPFYQVTYFINGKRTKKSTKTSSKSEALKFLKEFKSQQLIYFKPGEPKPEIKSRSIKLSEFEKEYTAAVSLSKSKHYLRSVKLSFKHFKDFIGDLPINEINLKQIDNFVTTIYARSESASSLYYRTLKAAFSKAVIWDYIKENPFKKIKAPKLAKSLPVFINEEQLQAILSETEEQYLKDIFTFAFYTGMRIGEILNMKWNWIDTTQNIIIIKNSSTFKSKSKKERIIPIHNKVNEILSRQKQNTAFVFYRYIGIKLNENFISKKFKAAVRDAKLSDDIHFHTLRHSFASNLVQKGANLYVVKELLGHEDIKTTQVYSHLTQSSLTNAVLLL
ncbi:MAG: tyrosine-type recombinase/integrase [Ignavibacterium sp.]|nr:tyrosine-type recombinase/integrase [Ignavibacterium sp.]